MALTGLKGPYQLTNERINEVVPQSHPGAYALGKYDLSSDTFYVKYVGRSDDDINDRLHDWVGEYSYFKYDCFLSAKLAYEKECFLWHDFGGPEGRLDNKQHPDKGDHKDWECPVCGK